MRGAAGGGWAARSGGPASTGLEVRDGGLRAVTCDAAGRFGPGVEIEASALGPEPFRAARARGVPRRVHACLPAAWTDVLPLRLPGSGDLEAQLVERARAHLSYPIEDAVLDYLEPEVRPDGARRALLYAVPRARVQELVAAAARGGVEIESLESAGTALHRALRQVGALDARRTLVVHLDRDGGLFVVADATHVHVERGLDWGLGKLEAALAAGLDVPAGAAAEILHAPGPTDVAPEDLASAVRDITAACVEELGLEIERVVGYCRAEFRDAGVERVLLAGAIESAAALREALGQRAGAACAGRPETDLVARGLALRGLEAACATST